MITLRGLRRKYSLNSLQMAKILGFGFWKYLLTELGWRKLKLDEVAIVASEFNISPETISE